jgi:uncharacterized protein (TIRG00374 family)
MNVALPVPARTWYGGRRTRLLVALAVLATIAVPILIGGVGVTGSVLRLSLAGDISIVGLMSVNWLARTLKLLCLSRRVGLRARFGPMLAVSLAADFGFMATPAGVGGYAASIHFLRRIGASASSAAAITAADQLLDVLFFVTAVPVAAIALSWTVMPHMMSAGLPGMLIVGSVLAMLLIVAYRWALRGGRRCPTRLHQGAIALRDFAKAARSDLRLLLTGGFVFSFGILCLTVLQQVSRYAVLSLVFALLGYRIPLAIAFVLQTLVVQAASWTGIPAGGGAAEIGLSASFAQWIPSAPLASALFIWRIATLYLGLIVGGLAILWLSSKSFQTHTSEP